MTLPPDLPEADGPRDHLTAGPRPEALTGPCRCAHARQDHAVHHTTPTGPCFHRACGCGTYRPQEKP